MDIRNTVDSTLECIIPHYQYHHNMYHSDYKSFQPLCIYNNYYLYVYSSNKH